MDSFKEGVEQGLPNEKYPLSHLFKDSKFIAYLHMKKMSTLNSSDYTNLHQQKHAYNKVNIINLKPIYFMLLYLIMLVCSPITFQYHIQ